MSDPRTTKHWVIKVNGSTKVDVGPGENVEIGRRPLRPLSDDGHHRLEIDDDTRSMSKRHALFSVTADGGASVTDLNSTNGSYIVEKKGLRPLTPNKDFIFPDSPMRLQFGDVPVDFVRVDVDENDGAGNKITDLFDYAVSGGESADIEPDLNEMSVDDILNLRAGEPTTAFSAADVASRIEASASSEADDKANGDPQNSKEQAAKNADSSTNKIVDGSASPVVAEADKKREDPQADHTIDQISLNVMTPEPQVRETKARDLFKDAMQTETESKAVKAVQPSTAAKKTAQPATTGASAPAGNQGRSSRAKLQAQQVSLPSRQGNGQNPQNGSRVQQPMDSPAAAQPQANVNGVNNNVNADVRNDNVTNANFANTNGSLTNANANGNAGANGSVSAGQFDPRMANATNGPAAPGQILGNQNAPVFVAMDENPNQGSGGGSDHPGLNLGGLRDSQNDAADSKASQERNKFMPPVTQATDTSTVSFVSSATNGAFGAGQAFKPSFEPGSVFEKVSNGEFNQPEPEVEVDGMSSQEAKQTADFSLQFEMAKHPELLPFLAMNPSLYDDLYAWLSAVGNDDIDAALSQNSGYIEYRNKVGEGRNQ
ncbi:FHA domain-containing protein [Bifidobacterium sp. ESL0769]|uniref:variant leucine-rich repeat-containing protein n=1 Tax=Bifidobacterium sp. ESL0769 TaxID=2983229 RepID=UPI0023F79E2C|nr:FHA domain-containing protein [Bifidobacterium sp. ESL0769]WEV67797.1 FHA domain-containing protein [Bifidobacterium sp. ESL0769]